jgi:soluble lytic murein transglycosylase-like protein
MPFSAATNPLFAPRHPVLSSPSSAVPRRFVAAGAESPGDQCLAAVQTSERAQGIPAGLLAAISRVESGRSDGHGAVTPWPWSINVEGADRVFDSKADAVTAVQDLLARGVRSIDVGCLQVNLMYHPSAFASIEDGFDPIRNAAYAARFLRELYDQSGNWDRATVLYHSATPGLGEPYQRKVAAVWADAGRGSSSGTRAAAAAALIASAAPLGIADPTAHAPLTIPPRGQRDLAAYRAHPVSIASNLTFRQTP